MTTEVAIAAGIGAGIVVISKFILPKNNNKGCLPQQLKEHIDMRERIAIIETILPIMQKDIKEIKDMTKTLLEKS